MAKQSEILFLWDVENSNPNGDILRDNAPRYDEISGRALVSDVRIKRTIRDDLNIRKGKEIFVKEQKLEKGLADGTTRVETLTENSKNKVETLIEKCIDVKAFGGVFPIKNKSYNLTGAMQFKMSKSIHRVDEPTLIKGTGAFASTKGKENKTFREEYILPYAMFGTYSITSELSSKESKLENSDVDEIINSLWIGTKNLTTRSKFGQLPRFLLKITYNQSGFFIGELDNKLKIESKVAQESEIRSLDDFDIDFSKLFNSLEKYKKYIDKIEYIIDDRFRDSFESKKAIPKDWIEYDISF